MKAIILSMTFIIAVATLLAACNAHKIGEIAAKAKTLNQRVSSAGCWDEDGSIRGTDYCLSVAFPSVDSDFMGGDQ